MLQLPSWGLAISRLAMVTLAGAALVGRLVFFFRPLDPDGAVFIYMGKLTASGGRVGFELVDNKFPTVGLITSIAWRLQGTWWPGYVLLQSLLCVVAALCLARAAGLTLGKKAQLPAALAALVLLNFNPAVFGGFQLESLQSFFSILAAASAIICLAGDDPRDALVCGLCAGMAAMLKPSGLAVLPAFALAALFHFRRCPARALWHGLACFAGLLIPLTAALVYLWQAGLLPALPALFAQISQYARATPWEAWDLSKPIVALLIVLTPAVLSRLLPRAKTSKLPISTGIVFFAIAWLMMETLGVVAQRRMYAYHFLVLAGPGALLFALAARARSASLLSITLAPVVALSVYSAIHLPNLSAPSTRLPSSDYLLAHATAGDSAWQDEMSRLLLETHLAPGSRIAATFLWVNDNAAPDRYSKMMIDDFEQRRTTWIILPADMNWFVPAVANHIKELGLSPPRRQAYIHAWDTIQRYVLAHYQLQATVGRQAIYRRSVR